MRTWAVTIRRAGWDVPPRARLEAETSDSVARELRPLRSVVGGWGGGIR
jgi:hypothetical protein